MPPVLSWISALPKHQPQVWHLADPTRNADALYFLSLDVIDSQDEMVPVLHACVSLRQNRSRS